MQKTRKSDPKTPPKSASAYPMRINKYLALHNYATRRGGDELVAKKKVLINGETAVLGDKVEEGDIVEVKPSGTPKNYVYYAYNKPIGVITNSPQNGEKDIKGVIGKSKEMKDVFPIGRLDKDSHGLIILTNDGRITDRLLNPDYVHDKEYIVETTQKLRDSFKKNIEAGVEIEDYTTRPCTVKILGESTFSITLTEGKKHQIRRMVVALHNEVLDLKRVRIMNILLGNLKPGMYRKIDGLELQTFLKSLGM